MINRILFPAIFAISLFSRTSLVVAQAFVDFESGVVFTGQNDVRIPGNAGTLFSLKTDLNARPGAFIRIRAGYTVKSR